MSQSAKKSLVLAEQWRERHFPDNTYSNTPIHNIWRGFRFTIKGKKIGCEDRWSSFANFCDDMLPTYFENAALCRDDKKKPFSKSNCFWTDRSNIKPSVTRILTYQGKTQSVYDWCYELDLNIKGVLSRYFRESHDTPETILFGKPMQDKKKLMSAHEITQKMLRSKASKMLAQYRANDKRRSQSICDFTITEFIETILLKECLYCGTNNYLGADRINNSHGHLKSNVVPACYECNILRGDKFTVDEMKKIALFIKTEIRGIS